MDDNLSDLTVVIVTFKTDRTILKNCLSSINNNVKIVIVENSKEFINKEEIEREYDNVRIICSGSNLGMGSGNNFGLKNTFTKYALILNPDIICDNSFFSNIQKYLKGNIDFSIIGTQYKDNSIYKPAGFFSSKKKNKEIGIGGERVRTSDLSAKTELKPASVTEMIQRLGEIGLVDYEPYHGVHLTKQGQHVADVIEHRFNILQRFLTEVLGVEKEEAAEVACRMEHILTRDVESRLTNFLGESQDTSSDLFCHQVNVDSESEPDFIPLTNLLFLNKRVGIILFLSIKKLYF